MHDILTSRLPDPHDDNATDILHDSIDLVAEEANRMKKARELVDILEDPHIMVLLLGTSKKIVMVAGCNIIYISSGWVVFSC